MDKRIVLAVFVSVFLLPTMFGKGFVTAVSASATLEVVWSQKSNMTYPRQYPNMGVVNGKIYVVGGRACKNDSDYGTRYKYNEEYDPATDTWTTKTPKPTAGDGGASGVVDGKFYVIGQYPSGTENYCYDPSTDSWSVRKSMPTKRFDTIGLVPTDPVGNDVIYVIGGCVDLTPFKTVEVYCPNNDTWIRKADLNTARAKQAGSVYNGKIYVFSGSYGVTTETAEEYDPATNTWTYIADTPDYVMCASQKAVCAVIPLLKIQIGESFKPNQWYYNPETNIYSQTTNFTLHDGQTPPLERPVVNNTLYLIGGGGWDGGSGTYKKNICYSFTIKEKTAPVGGILISPNKLELLAPWIALASATVSATAATAVFLKRRKEKQ